MEVGVGIALFSMMITVITLLLGFLLVSSGGLFGELSGMIGFLKGYEVRMRRSGCEEEVLTEVRSKIEDGKRTRVFLETMFLGGFVWFVWSVVIILSLMEKVGVPGWEEWVFVGWLVFVSNLAFVVVGVFAVMIASARTAELRRQREASAG